jgi:hypothetical protein
MRRVLSHVAVYWLRVPPQMQTAREAVAWTFDKSPDEYEPAFET